MTFTRLNQKEHVRAVEKWLAENVLVYEAPTLVEVSDFTLDAARFSGSFQVALDGVTIPDRFSFGLGANGKPELYFPMFHSPLGAPGSYARVELTNETELAIGTLLASVLPDMKALGFNRDTGEMIFHTTHSVSDRILDRTAYAETMELISKQDFIARCVLTDNQTGGTRKSR